MEDWWHDLKPLKRHRKLSAAAKLCFEELWRMAGGRPGEIVISPAVLATELGRDPRRIDTWLAELQKWGLIEVLERDKARGRTRLYVFHPNPDLRQSIRPDPQLVLPLEFAADPSAVTAPKPPIEEAASAVTAQERGGFGAERSDPSAVTAQERGGFGAERSDPSAVTAPKPPTTPREAGGEPHARARSTSTSTDEDDVDKWSTSTSTSTDDQKEISGEDEPARWLEAVGRAYDLIERYPRLRARSQDPRNRSLFLKACYLAQTMFSDDWLIDSLEAVSRMRSRDGKPPNPWAYLHACLADKAGMCPEDFNRLLAPITLTLADEMIALRQATIQNREMT